MKEKTDIGRRNFLKGSIAGAGAFTTGFGGGLFLPRTAHAATAPTLPLPYCRTQGGAPTTTPAVDNQTVLDPDDVRVRAWWYYSNGKG